MGILVLTSRQSAGINPARTQLIERIIENYKKTPFNLRNKIFVITPRQNTYQIERELISKLGQGGLFGIHVLDFETLLERIIEDKGSQFDIVDEHGRLMLMQKTLSDIKPSLKVYSASTDKQGFAEQVVEQVSDLKRAKIEAQMLLEQAQQFDGTLLSDKMIDLGLILERFTENLGEDRLDEDDLLFKALEITSHSSLLENSQLYFLDYSTIDFNQAVFMIQASKIAKTIEVALILDRNRNATDMTAFLAANESLYTLTQLCRESNVDLEVETLPIVENNKALSTLSNELFSYIPHPYNGDHNVSLYQEKDPWEEVNRIAQLIALEVNNGRKLSEIAVVMSDRETYESLIRKVFAQYQIPIFIDDTHKVTDNHFIQSIISALDSVDSEYNRAEILSYIKSDFSGLTSDQADLIENYAIEAGVRPWEWKKTFKRVPSSWRLEEETLSKEHEINVIRKKIINNLKVLGPSGSKEETFNYFIDQLKSFLEKTGSQERLIELSDEMSERGNEELASRYRQIWNILFELLDQMKNTLGEIPTTFSNFISVLKAGLSSYEIGVIPEDQESVIIATLDRTKLPAVDSLYFAGLNEGKLPKSFTDTSLFSDYDKERLNQVFELEQNQMKDRQYRHKLEELNFYSLVTKPSKRLTFTYANFDQDGFPLLPSRFVGVLDQIYPEGLRRERPKLLNILTPARAEVIMETLDPEESITQKVREILHKWRKENHEEESRFISPDLLRAAGEDKLLEHNAAELYTKPGQNLKVSASRLEQFSNCPYRHFINYGLRPVEREEYEVRALDTGIVVHEVFDNFINSIHERALNDPKAYQQIIRNYINDLESLQKDCNKIFDSVLDRVHDSKRYQHTGASRYLLVKIKRIIYTSLLIMLRQLADSEYIPYSMEQSFSETTDSGVVIEGRIDRIDIPSGSSESERPIRVIDYKTGQKSISYSDLYYGRALQLALYLSEAVKYLDTVSDDQFKPGGAFYFLADNASVDNSSYIDLLDELEKNYKMVGIYDESEFKNTKDLRAGRNNETSKTPSKLTEEELRELLEHTDKKIKELTRDLAGGKIEMTPTIKNGEQVGCMYCSYKDICRYNPANEEAKTNIVQDLTKEEFFSLLEEDVSNE